MKIAIVDRLKAFSHVPGHEAMIPGSIWKVRAFPAALFLESCEEDQPAQAFFWDLKGPISPFTIEQDIDQMSLRIYGVAKQGYFRFVLKVQNLALSLHVEKAPKEGIGCLDSHGKEHSRLYTGNELVLAQELLAVVAKKERLFLGNTKQKEWEKIRRQNDLTAMLPIWFSLGQNTPDRQKKEEGPVLVLLQTLKEQSALQDRLVVLATIEDLFRVGFTGGLVPRVEDTEWQGIIPFRDPASSLTALSLLPFGAKEIRSLFFQEERTVFQFLPCLPPGLVFGKMFQITTKQGDQIDFEWSKNQIRKVIILIQEDREELLCSFPQEIQSYRIRRGSKDKGSILPKGKSFSVRKGERIWLDRFAK